MVDATVDVKRGRAKLVTTDQRKRDSAIRKAAKTSKFKVVSIKGPTKLKR